MTLDADVREFALSPDKFIDIGQGVERHIDDRACIIQGNIWAGVGAVRIADTEVASLVQAVRRMVPAEKSLVWFIDPDAQPADLEPRLLQLGLRKASGPGYRVHALACIEAPPAAPGEIAVRRVETFEDWKSAAEIMWEAHETSPDKQELQRARLRSDFEDAQAAGVPVTFLAELDGRPAGIGRSIYSPRGVFLLAGGVSTWARRRGVYRALIRARWDDAVARGTPALVTEALTDTSYPILTRLGFVEVGTIRRLEDPRS